MATENSAERSRYSFLKALHEKNPQCKVLKDEIAPIEEAHSWNWDGNHRLEPRLTVSGGKVAIIAGDPFTASELRNMSAGGFVEQLTRSQRQEQPAELIPPLLSVQETVREDFEWGNTVARALEVLGNWSEPVWKDIMRGWNVSGLQEGQCREMLGWFAKPDVYTYHADVIVENLHGLVRNGGKPYATRLIDEAENVALPLWEHLRCDEIRPVQRWHEAAFNYCQVGHLTRFWLEATAVRKSAWAEATFSSACLTGLRQIIADTSMKGYLGAAVLAGQADFLFQTNPLWAQENIQPMFTHGGERERAAWGGLIEGQSITRHAAEILGETFQGKFIELADQTSNEQRSYDLLANAYTKMLCYYAPRPGEWLKETIGKCHDQTAVLIAGAMGRRLREADPEQQGDWWKRWMRSYWQDRNMGLPKRATPSEGAVMVGWTPLLTESFPEAVELVRETPWEGDLTGLFAQLERSSFASKHPDSATELLTSLMEKSGISIAWASAKGVLEQIEQASPTNQNIERVEDLKSEIDALIKSIG